MSRKIKEKILELRNLGYSYRKIQDELKCSRSVISYHCGIGQKEKLKFRNNKYSLNVKNKLTKKINFFSINHNKTTIFNKNLSLFKSKLKSKLERFSKMSNRKTAIYIKPSFTSDELLAKIGDEPKCYLTGAKIDLENTKSWNLDHIIPRSKGGDNTLNNANICTKEANQAKSDTTLEEFLNLCKSVLEHNGYNVEKILTD